MSTQEAKINKLQQSIDEIRVELKSFAKKDDLKVFVTKDFFKKELERLATKDDLKDLEFNLRYDMHEEMQKYVTKDDMIGFKDEILTAINRNF